MGFPKWTREQTIVALNLYCKIPFNKVNSTHPDIIRIAHIIKRSANSVKMKIGNFGSFDPELKKRGIVGLGNTSKLDQQVWDEFNSDWSSLSYESEVLLSNLIDVPIEEIANVEIADFPEGIDRERLIKQRVNQNFFRSMILASYNYKCCITGLSVTECLVASHIIPWSKDKKNRLNPQNGLCLNAIHDKAFDKGLITITPDYKVKLSPKLQLNFTLYPLLEDFFLKYNGISISKPDRFLPSQDFLKHHNEKIFLSKQ